MDVSLVGQMRRAGHTVPQPHSTPPTAARAGASSPGAAVPELFDANGDGVIENWSIAHGGDSFANFDPPPSGTVSVPEPKSHRGTGTSIDANGAHLHAADHKTGHTSTPVAIQHAHDAYERDGTAGSQPASSPKVDTTPLPIAGPIPAPASVPQPVGEAPLRSPPS
jgi:hypothetical protein